jgi:hypothetical protein
VIKAMGLDQRCVDVLVSKQLLKGANVLAPYPSPANGSAAGPPMASPTPGWQWQTSWSARLG